MPLLILWLGIGIESKIAIVFLGAIFSNCDERDGWNAHVGRAFIALCQIIWCHRPPNPPDHCPAQHAAFLDCGHPFGGWACADRGGRRELVASTAGIGHMMAMASAPFQTDKVFVGVMILAATGYGLTELLSRTEAHFERWRPLKPTRSMADSELKRRKSCQSYCCPSSSLHFCWLAVCHQLQHQTPLLR